MDKEVETPRHARVRNRKALRTRFWRKEGFQQVTVYEIAEDAELSREASATTSKSGTQSQKRGSSRDSLCPGTGGPAAADGRRRPGAAGRAREIRLPRLRCEEPPRVESIAVSTEGGPRVARCSSKRKMT